MAVAFASVPLFAALHQATCVVVTVLLASLWLVAVVLVCTFLLSNLLWARGRFRSTEVVSMSVLPFLRSPLFPLGGLQCSA